jgi:hypothetical protein
MVLVSLVLGLLSHGPLKCDALGLRLHLVTWKVASFSKSYASNFSKT